MERHVKWYIASIIWAIVGVIGLIMLFTAPAPACSPPPQLLSLSEVLSLLGFVGSWLSFATGATAWGQTEMLKRQDDMLKRQDEMLKRQDEALQILKGIEKRQDDVLQVLKEIRDMLRS